MFILKIVYCRGGRFHLQIATLKSASMKLRCLEADSRSHLIAQTPAAWKYQIQCSTLTK